MLIPEVCLGNLEVIHQVQVPHYVCRVMLSSTVLFTTPNSEKLQNYCNPDNLLTLGSISHCLIDNFDHNLDSINDFLSFCNNNISLKQFYDGYNQSKSIITAPPSGSDFLANSTSLPPGVYSSPKPYNLPIKFKQKDVLQQFKANWNGFNQTNYSIWFGLSLILYWVLIILIATVNNWSYWIIPNLIKKCHNYYLNLFRSNFILAPLFSNNHARSRTNGNWIHYFVPLRFEALVLLGWLLLCIFFLIFQNHPRSSGTVAFTVGLRIGVLVIFSIPVLILFPGRNNFLQWLTGWPYYRFLLFHRWIGRIVFTMLIVHAICLTIATKRLDLYDFWFETTWLRLGAVAITSISLVIITSFQYFRKCNYEGFVISHIILVVIFIIGCWLHVKPRGHKFLYPFYSIIAIWSFDRLIRILRLICFGIQKADIKLINDDTLKIVSNRPHWWVPHPGSHGFVYIVNQHFFWQSHPFTIVDSVTQPNTISFYIKVKNGMTHKLKSELRTKPECQGVYRIIVEGPYSQQLPLRKFENVVFLAGGNGVPGLYFEALKLIRNNQTKVSTKRVRFYWIIHNFESINWFYPELLLLKNTFIEPIIYITQPEMSVEEFNTSFKQEPNSYLRFKNFDTVTSSLSSKVSLSDIKQNLNFIKFCQGRPNIQHIVNEEVEIAQGAIAFAVCSCEIMVDDTRLAVRNALSKETSKRIDYFEELQGW